MLFKIQCVECDNVFKVECDRNDYARWQKGEYIQNTMPYLSPDERELLKTHICGDCWNKMFGDSE